MKNRKKALIIAMICLAAAAVLYLLVVKMNQKEANSEADGFTGTDCSLYSQ